MDKCQISFHWYTKGARPELTKKKKPKKKPPGKAKGEEESDEG